MSWTSGSKPLGHVWLHWPWRRYMSALHLVQLLLPTHSSHPSGHSDKDRCNLLRCLDPSFSHFHVAVKKRRTCAFSQCSVCGQPVRTAAFTFAPEQKVAGMTAGAKVFAEAGGAIHLALCRPIGMNLGHCRATTLSSAKYCCLCWWTHMCQSNTEYWKRKENNAF